MRLRLITGLAVALLFLGSATAYAAWSDSAAIGSSARIAAGTFGITATWASPPPDFGSLYPGQSKTAIVKVTHAGDGRWQYQVSAVSTGVTGLTVTYRAVTLPATCDT